MACDVSPVVMFLSLQYDIFQSSIKSSYCGQPFFHPHLHLYLSFIIIYHSIFAVRYLIVQNMEQLYIIVNPTRTLIYIYIYHLKFIILSLQYDILQSSNPSYRADIVVNPISTLIYIYIFHLSSIILSLQYHVLQSSVQSSYCTPSLIYIYIYHLSFVSIIYHFIFAVRQSSIQSSYISQPTLLLPSSTFISII